MRRVPARFRRLSFNPAFTSAAARFAPDRPPNTHRRLYTLKVFQAPFNDAC